MKRDGTLVAHGYGAYNDSWCPGSMEKGWKPESVPQEKVRR